ncbi:DUF4288 domain-containing protein, partial [Streptomyces sp. NPDC059385]|uniref:DUF4288 domain-containing protein n=1 Tax=Streptomyces sp. NPDC059385 TaxID=3346817 RepID=UPI0036C574EB
MTTYIAVLLCETSADSNDHAPLYQESFVLLTAADEARAREKAEVHGKSLETSYENEAGELITWRLRHVVEGGVCGGVGPKHWVVGVSAAQWDLGPERRGGT